MFGADVVYDCPSAKFMEQKRFVKFGLTSAALRSYVPMIEDEVLRFVAHQDSLQGDAGVMDVPECMAGITILTAARTLQGEEVRGRLEAGFAELYHDLDLGFRPVNLLMPWAPLPDNRRRDAAHAKMREVYSEIIEERRREGKQMDGDVDMIWNLMGCSYKDGSPVPNHEIAHMMITLLMAGQHTSSSASSWVVLHLASRPEVTEQLYQEQLRVLGEDLPPLQHEHLEKLPLLQHVIKETLRMHSSIHSVMRKATRAIPVPETTYVIPPGRILLASPQATARDEENFTSASEWLPHRWSTEAESEDGIFDAAETSSISRGARSAYLPFGAGRHRCIGEKFAYVNLGAIVATLVREFRFFEGGEVPETDYASMFSRPKQPARVRWERRRRN